MAKLKFIFIECEASDETITQAIDTFRRHITDQQQIESHPTLDALPGPVQESPSTPPGDGSTADAPPAPAAAAVPDRADLRSAPLRTRRIKGRRGAKPLTTGITTAAGTAGAGATREARPRGSGEAEPLNPNRIGAGAPSPGDPEPTPAPTRSQRMCELDGRVMTRTAAAELLGTTRDALSVALSPSGQSANGGRYKGHALKPVEA
jgi:hypothetical protein